MKREQLQKMIAFHESRLKLTKAMLDAHYDDLELTGDEDKWLKQYVQEKQMLDWLRQQKADDES